LGGCIESSEKRMSTNRRFILGCALGAMLSLLAAFLSAGDRGTYAPMIANSAFVMFFPGGIYTMLWAPVFMWGIYYAAIPDMGSRMLRITFVLVVALLHLGFAFWASQDSALLLAFRDYRGIVLLHAALFVFALVWLVYLALNPARAKTSSSPLASTQQIVRSCEN
jgi:hypothetical protein